MTYKDKTWCQKYETCPFACDRKLSKEDIKIIVENKLLVSFCDFETTDMCIKNLDKTKD